MLLLELRDLGQDGILTYEPFRQLSTIHRCISVSGEGLLALGVPRRSSWMVSSACAPDMPWRTRKQLTTVPVRPSPPRQCT